MTLLIPDGKGQYVPHEGKAEVVAKAATGAGVGFFSTAPPLYSMARTPQEVMKRAQLAYHVNPWVGTAESVITRKVVGLPWHLEDGEDEEYEPGKEAPEVAAARLLIERPQFLLPEGSGRPATASRRLMWSITSRHTGLCGMSHWYGDQMDIQGIPVAWLYINPARMWAYEDERGNLTGWMLDATGVNGNGTPYGGTPLELKEVLTFYLDPPDHGNYGTGWYERGILKAQVSNYADQHAAYVLGTGGRIAGIVSPKEGSIPDEKFKTLVSEFRNVNEAPDAAKRTTIMQGPTDFTPTAADPTELQLTELSKMSRDDILSIAGVPNSQAGIETPAGLNSGGTKQQDEAVLMQGPVHDRVVAITETVQYGWLDRYLPTVIELVIEEPEYDDKTPAFALLTASREAPLTNAQRLELVGLPPTGDPAIDNAILLPSTLTVWATAPGDGAVGGIEEKPAIVQVPAAPVAESGSSGKASAQREFLGLRKSLDQRTVPAVEKSVGAVLADQRKTVVAWLRAHQDHIAKKPTDMTWWNEKREAERLTTALRPHVAGIAQTVTKRAKDVLDRPAKAEFEDRVEAELLNSVGIRIAGINKHTRDAISEAIRQAFADGLSPAEVADVIEESTLFSEVRAETIARTETMFAYNAAAIDSYREFGVEKVQALDGDEDEVCAARDLQVYSLEEASSIEDHPNGTLDWMPYFGKAEEMAASPTTPPPGFASPVAAPPLDIAALIAQAVEAGSGGWRSEVERLEASVKALLDHAMTPLPEPAAPPVFNITMPEMTMPPVNMTIAEGAIAPVFNMPPQKATRVLRDPKTNEITGSEPVDGA